MTSSRLTCTTRKIEKKSMYNVKNKSVYGDGIGVLVLLARLVRDH